MSVPCAVTIHDDNGSHFIPVELDDPKSMHGELWCEMMDAVGDDVAGWLTIDGETVFGMERIDGVIIEKAVN